VSDALSARLEAQKRPLGNDLRKGRERLIIEKTRQYDISSPPVGHTTGMAKHKRKHNPKTVLKLPDLEQSISAVLNSLTSPTSQRSYDHAICEFID